MELTIAFLVKSTPSAVASILASHPAMESSYTCAAPPVFDHCADTIILLGITIDVPLREVNNSGWHGIASNNFEILKIGIASKGAAYIKLNIWSRSR